MILKKTSLFPNELHAGALRIDDKETEFLSRVVHTHIHGLTPTTKKTHDFLTRGDLPFEEYASLLRQHAYSGIWNLEIKLPAENNTYLEALGFFEAPLDYLPGKNEGLEFKSSLRARTVRGCLEPEDLDGVFLLTTSTTEEPTALVDALLARMPQSGACLVFAHFPPFLVGEERLLRLQNGST